MRSLPGARRAELLGLARPVEAPRAVVEPGLGDGRRPRLGSDAPVGAGGAAIPLAGDLLRREPEPFPTARAGAPAVGRAMVDHGAGSVMEIVARGLSRHFGPHRALDAL